MMPGQTPYTDEERAQLLALVADAADDDPGEADEPAVGCAKCGAVGLPTIGHEPCPGPR